MNDVQLHRFISTDNMSMPPVVKPLTVSILPTGQVIATIQQASQQDIEAAVQSATRSKNGLQNSG
jgi:acyl-CoA reductase-like NAD-dependent aldehyde dehydrogenase